MQVQQGQSTPPNKGRSRARLIILIVAIVFTVVLAIVGLYTQGWSSNISLILSGFGVLLGFFQLLVPLPGSPPLVSRPRKSTTQAATNQEYEVLRKQLEKRHKTTNLGALVVYVKKPLVGFKVNLTDSQGTSQETVVAERWINRRIIYVAVLENLAPGIYHVTMRNPNRAYVGDIYETAIAVQAEEVWELYRLGWFFNNWYGNW